jgi:redox-sensitive bicupin YhaK (pirin superfamily)
LGVEPGRRIYLHVARGGVTANDAALHAGDALKVETGRLDLSQGQDAEVLVFDLPLE